MARLLWPQLHLACASQSTTWSQRYTRTDLTPTPPSTTALSAPSRCRAETSVTPWAHSICSAVSVQVPSELVPHTLRLPLRLSVAQLLALSRSKKPSMSMSNPTSKRSTPLDNHRLLVCSGFLSTLHAPSAYGGSLHTSLPSSSERDIS